MISQLRKRRLPKILSRLQTRNTIMRRIHMLSSWSQLKVLLKLFTEAYNKETWVKANFLLKMNSISPVMSHCCLKTAVKASSNPNWSTNGLNRSSSRFRMTLCLASSKALKCLNRRPIKVMGRSIEAFCHLRRLLRSAFHRPRRPRPCQSAKNC